MCHKPGHLLELVAISPPPKTGRFLYKICGSRLKVKDPGIRGSLTNVIIIGKGDWHPGQETQSIWGKPVMKFPMIEV